ncbi:MAG: hypothetical protein ABIM19_09195 [candidate division WOR-3 bacterium]
MGRNEKLRTLLRGLGMVGLVVGMGCGGKSGPPLPPGDSDSSIFMNTPIVNILVDATDVDSFGTDTVYIGISTTQDNQGKIIRFILVDIDDWADDLIIDTNATGSLDNLNPMFPESSDVVINEGGEAIQKFVVSEDYSASDTRWRYHPGDNWELQLRSTDVPIPDSLDTITVSLWKRIWVEMENGQYLWTMPDTALSYANRVFRGVSADPDYNQSDSCDHRLYIFFETDTPARRYDQNAFWDTFRLTADHIDTLDTLMKLYWDQPAFYFMFLITTGYLFTDPADTDTMWNILGYVYDMNYPLDYTRDRVMVIFREHVEHFYPQPLDFLEALGGVIAHESGHYFAFIKHTDFHGSGCIMDTVNGTPEYDLDRFCPYCVRRFRRYKDQGGAEIFYIGRPLGKKEEER